MKKTKIYYTSVDQFWTKQEKFDYLQKAEDINGIEWKEIIPDSKYNWLTEGLAADFETFLAMGSKESKSSKTQDVKVIFKMYSTGMMTGRDAWVYNFNEDELSHNIQRMIESFNEQARKWNQRKNTALTIDEFVNNDEMLISWSRDLKKYLQRNIELEYYQNCVRKSLYRPFTNCFVYFSPYIIDIRGKFYYTFPTQEIEKENLYIAVTNHSQVPFIVQISNYIPDVAVGGRISQCFPFYTYNEDGSNRQENITDWALKQYQNHYQDPKITKWDIFYYIYAILHHPIYRNHYEANLKKELPRIPFAPQFTPFAIAGKQLADLHLNYENQPEYPLKFIENDDLPLNWRVEKMRLSKDKTQIIYNEFLTLSGIPQEVFTYKLGNRSALDWIIDQYQIKTDKRSGIINDPNRLDDEQYIIRLIGQIITVSLETMKIVNSLPLFRDT